MTSAGLPLPHDSASLHVAGEAAYVDDFPLPADGLYAALALSSQAHAAVRINLDGLRRDGSVVAVAAADDVPGVNDVAPVTSGDPLFAEEVVHYAGQCLYAVAADSELVARRAAAVSSTVAYRQRRPILTIEEALRRKAFLRDHFFTLHRGNPVAAIAGAPHRLRGRLRVGGQEHFYLEGQVAVAVPLEDGGMRVCSSTQNPGEIQKLVARVLAVPMHRVVVETRRMGGGFGGKETQAALPACVAAVLAHQTGRAVKCRLPRAEDFLVTGKRHPFLMDYAVGFDGAGRILGVDARLAADCGMSADLSFAIIRRAVFHADNAYYYPAARLVGVPCRTNKASNTAFRGFGGPQGMLLAERMVDDIARFLGRDAFAVRRVNFLKHGQRTPYGQRVRRPPIGELFDAMAPLYERTRRSVGRFNRRNTLRKRGVAVTPVKFGISFTTAFLNQAGALLQIYHDGSVALNHGGTEMGQGLFIKVAQIVADTLGVPISAIRCQTTSTGRIPNASATAASSGTDLNGMAAANAATILRQRLATVAAARWGCRAEEVRFVDGVVRCGRRRLSFAELVDAAYHERVSLSATGYYRTPGIGFDEKAAVGTPFFYYAWGAALSLVEVDVETGENRLLAVDILHDVGNSINPAIDVGQIEGGFVQGWGWLSTEEVVWNEQGVLMTTGPATYKIPTAGDMPPRFGVRLWRRENEAPTIMRSKAVGEPPLMLAISAWAAVADAIGAAGGDPKSLVVPATPENILTAIPENYS